MRDLINVELWDRARWRGVVFGRGGPHERLYVALVYQDRDAAAEIFRDWHEHIGPVDINELIRLAVVEGDIPGKSPGYTVHISPNVERLLATRDPATKAPVEFFTRLQRMPNPTSPHLARFKQDVAEEPRYLLMAAALTGPESFALNPIHAIEKTRIVFRQARDIQAQHDVDSIVLAREEGRTGAWN
jgi:hypothetical protein